MSNNLEQAARILAALCLNMPKLSNGYIGEIINANII